MSANSSSANRIAKNTFFLYVRSFVIMAITIYTSRVVLKVLGVEDYGIYNLVGGVVALFSSLKGVFSSAIQRYINYTRGLGDEEGVKHIFSLSIIIQAVLALLFFGLVESFGLWFIPHKLIIPEGMMDTAMFVFHCSLITSVISVLAVPFDALVIANEKMNYYAYISITEAVLKLAIVFALPVLPFIQLKSYAVLIMAVHVLIVMINMLYCRRFSECRIEKYWNKDLFKQLASFSGWNFLGNIVYTLIQEGTNIILNLFAGVIANAARGIAAQVRSALTVLSDNLYTASKPFVMQQAATVEKKTLFNYIYILSRVIFYVMLITTIPIIIYAEQILGIWLVEIPQYTVSFVRVIMLYVLVRSFHSPIVMLFFAVGSIKRFQITECVTGVLGLPLIYGFLYCGLPLYSAFIAMIIIDIINLLAIVLVAQKEMGFKLTDYLLKVISRCGLAFVAVAVVAGAFYYFTHNANKYIAIIWFVLLAFSELAVVYFVVLQEEEKLLIKNMFAKVKNRKNNQSVTDEKR